MMYLGIYHESPEAINRCISLRKAWEKYYTDMGLADNKKRHKVFDRVRKGKFPTK